MSDMIRSAVAGVVWPAIPDDHAARMLTLQLQLEQSQWLPVEKLRGRQLRQFDAAFRHAVKTVPYYRERFAARIAGVSGWEEYRRLPVSTRRDVQDAGSAMHSEAPPPEHGAVVVTESSGSTGSPLVTRGTAWTQMLWQGFLLRDHLWHRRDLAGKLVAIRSKTSEQRLPGWGPATAPFATGPSVVRGLSSDLDEQLQWLVAECDRRGVVVDVTLARGAVVELGQHIAFGALTAILIIAAVVAVAGRWRRRVAADTHILRAVALMRAGGKGIGFRCKRLAAFEQGVVTQKALNLLIEFLRR